MADKTADAPQIVVDNSDPDQIRVLINGEERIRAADADHLAAIAGSLALDLEEKNRRLTHLEKTVDDLQVGELTKQQKELADVAAGNLLVSANEICHTLMLAVGRMITTMALRMESDEAFNAFLLRFMRESRPEEEKKAEEEDPPPRPDFSDQAGPSEAPVIE